MYTRDSIMERDAVVIGGGGHGAVLIEALLSVGHPKIQLIDDNQETAHLHKDVSYLGGFEAIESLNADQVYAIVGVGSLPGRSYRFELAKRIAEASLVCPPVVHASAVLASDLRLVEGVQIMAGAVIQPKVTLGEHVILNTRSTIDHDCAIGRGSHVAPGVVLSGGVKVGEYAHLGTAASAIQNMTIGSHAVVAAGSCVYKSVPDRCLYKQGQVLERDGSF